MPLVHLICLLSLLFPIRSTLAQKDSAEFIHTPGPDFVTIRHPFEKIIPEFIIFCKHADTIHPQTQIGHYKLAKKQLKNQWSQISILYKNDTVLKVSFKNNRFIVERQYLKIKARTNKNSCLKKLTLFAYGSATDRYYPEFTITRKKNKLIVKTYDFFLPGKKFNPYPYFNETENFLFLFYD